MGVPVGGLSSVEQPLHPGAVGRQRSSPVCWQTLDNLLPGYIKPDRDAVAIDQGAVVAVGVGPAAGGDHHVSRRQEIGQDRPLDRSEMRLAPPREDLGHRQSLTPFHQRVDVLYPPAQPHAQRVGQRALAGAHEPHEVNLVRAHSLSGAPPHTPARSLARARRTDPRQGQPWLIDARTSKKPG